MFPHTQKHTLGRVINLDVAQKCSIFIGSVVTSTPPSQYAPYREKDQRGRRYGSANQKKQTLRSPLPR